ncbi:hypothetical protein B0H13DRAFT_1904976 [Mycena leptocephala]|nr:hypothetical protein B0H13DRAFT_1904976 [Mycena leptocephala]
MAAAYQDNLLYDIQWVGQSGELYVRAKKCHKSGLAKGPCGECKFLSSIPDVQRLVQRTSGPLPVTRNLKYYNHFQLADVVHEKNEEMNLPKLKVVFVFNFAVQPFTVVFLGGLKLRDKYQIATSRLSDHEIFLSTVAMDDMSSVGRLVAVCLKQKRAISEITNRISLSIRGIALYSHLGAQALLRACQGTESTSVHTVQSKSNFPTIRPCVGFPLCKEIEANLDSVHDTQVFWERGKPLPCRGFSLLIDEIALEQRPKYDTDRDCVVGFSRFDAASGDMYHPTEETLGEMVDAIREGTLTRATEATFPCLFPAPVNGRRTVLQTKWILEIIKTWTESPNGAAFYGPLWSIASDGDAVRRRALHTIAWRKHYPLLAPSSATLAAPSHEYVLRSE